MDADVTLVPPLNFEITQPAFGPGTQFSRLDNVAMIGRAGCFASASWSIASLYNAALSAYFFVASFNCDRTACLERFYNLLFAARFPFSMKRTRRAMNPTDFNTREVTRYISATTIGKLKAVIEQGKVDIAVWRLSDQNVIRWHREVHAGCACGCLPPE